MSYFLNLPTMKLIHTADWHIGHQLFNYDRTDEFVFFFDQLTSAISDEQPDVLIVAGDVFDRSIPSLNAQQLFTQQIMRLHSACPTMTIVVISGNHDSRQRLELTHELWQLVNVHVVGTYHKLDNDTLDCNHHIIPVYRDNARIGSVIALPYCFPTNIPGEEPDNEERLRRLISHLTDMATAQQGNADNIVCTAHLTVDGRMSEIGGEERFDSSVFDERLTYTALGHIHNYDFLGKERIRYAGTPIAMAFDEVFKHRIVVVECINGGEEISSRDIEIKQLRPLVTVNNRPMSYEEIMTTATAMDKSVPSYIKFIIANDGLYHADMINELSHMFEDTETRFCNVERERVKHTAAEEGISEIDYTSFREETPIETAKRYYRDTFSNEEMSDELTNRLKAVITEIEEEDRQ